MAWTRMALAGALMAAQGAGAPAAADGFVLVHGAFQTADAWAGVAERLEAAGHEAVAVNLPGRAGDGLPPGEVTMGDHVAAVSAAAAALEGPVHLVGHSFGGMVISATAEAMPERLAALIYVAACLPAVGESPGQSMQALAEMDHHNGFAPDSFVVSPDYASASINPRDRAALFAADADPALARAIADAMVDEPLDPIAMPVALTPGRFGSVRAAYVATLLDATVSPALQLTMIGRGEVDEVIPLDAGHSPHEVAPDALVAALLAAATPALE